MGKNRQLREAKVVKIKERLEKTRSVVLASYQGLTVEQDINLRKSLREAGIGYKVYKDTLVTLATKESGFDGIVEHLEGPVSAASSYGDATAPARILSDFAKENRKLESRAAVVEETVCNKGQTEQLAAIPSREVLLVKLLGSIKSPLSSFVYLLSAIVDKKEESAE